SSPTTKSGRSARRSTRCSRKRSRPGSSGARSGSSRAGATTPRRAWSRSGPPRDPRVRLVSQPVRRGKAFALQEVFRRARGDWLVLLNADAVAAPGAVAELLARAGRLARPFAVMARPVPPAPPPGDRVGELLALLWDLHHEFHREVVGRPGPAHLADELLLLSLPDTPPIEEGVINDGAYLAVRLAQRGGQGAYADRARVSIEVPQSFREHLNQRRRILAGHRQVGVLAGRAPATLPGLALRDPRRALAVLRRARASSRASPSTIALLFAGEALAGLLSLWDRVPPRRSHAVWRSVATGSVAGISPPPPAAPDPPDPAVAARIANLVTVAERFGTSLDLEELVGLMPPHAPWDAERLRGYLEARPELGRVEAGRLVAPGRPPPAVDGRRERGRDYLARARQFADRDLRPVLPWLRCVLVTGSTAYGAPAPGDDLDLFVVTRPGAVWLFLAYVYLEVRLRYRPDPAAGRPPLCFNFVVDAPGAIREFRRPRGFLVARDALTARPLLGDDYYKRLLREGAWMEQILPRLYAERWGDEPVPPPAPVGLAPRL
ncbi:secreted protein containing Glycosyl transferase, family 2 domain protein, partial [mine drainage metagenome]